MENINLLIDESVKFELDIYDLYTHFKDIFPDDSVIWNTLADEEANHAALLRKSKSLFLKKDEVLNIVGIEDINILKENRVKIKDYYNEIKQNPTPHTAYKIAIRAEKSIIENNYEKFMTSTINSNLNDLFKMLNGAEKDHVNRIREYFEPKYNFQ